jgi:superoxide dismutase, Cu-Zn family
MKPNLSKIAAMLVAVVLALFVFATAGARAQEKSKDKAKDKMKSMKSMTGMAHDAMIINKAVVVLYPTQGNAATGVVTFTKEEGGIHVVAKLTGVPKGDHGFHIHEFGDCSAADGTSAGGHFNPTAMQHAGPMADKRHVGDLGNVTADDQGNVALDYVDKHLAFMGPSSIIGHAVILHANADDFTTQPTGNAGGRIACGVIGVAK